MSPQDTETGAPQRWCIHVPGPDDLYAMRSKEDAERAAKEHNEAMAKWIAWRNENDPSPHYPSDESVMAVVVEWPHEPVGDEEWERMCREDEEP